MKSSGIGGQAVLEGIMMKNGDEYAVAVRRPDKEIEVKKEVYKGFLSKHPAFNIPIIRGVFAFVDSLVLGVGTLNFSASFYEEETEEKPSKLEGFLDKKLSKKTQEKIMTVLTVMLSVVLCVAIFMLAPVWLVGLLGNVIHSQTVLALIEGVLRIAIFILYVALISRMQDIKRVFMYHGAEHKCINCIEHGLDLTVDNVQKSSKEHKRCGTSFLLIVMAVSYTHLDVYKRQAWNGASGSFAGRRPEKCWKQKRKQSGLQKEIWKNIWERKKLRTKRPMRMTKSAWCGGLPGQAPEGILWKSKSM